MVPVTIEQMVDPDGDPVAITVLVIRQDEPITEGKGARTEPDGAGVGADTGWPRAERSGNGRVYRIQFRADDGKGGSGFPPDETVLGPGVMPGLSFSSDRHDHPPIAASTDAQNKARPGHYLRLRHPAN